MLDREYQYNCTQIHLYAIYQMESRNGPGVESRIASVPMPYECGKPRHTTDEIYRHNDDHNENLFFFAHGRTSYLLRMCEEVILLYNQYQAKSPSSILRLHN